MTKTLSRILLVAFVFNLLLLPQPSRAAGWVSQTQGSSELQDIDFLGASATVIAVGNGGTILRSTNSGATWTPISSGTTRAIYSIDSASPDGGATYTVWAGSNGSKIYKSTNSGVSWTETSDINIDIIYGIDFLNTATGFAVGTTSDGLTGFIKRSTDGGTTWPTHWRSAELPGGAPGLLAIKCSTVSVCHAVGVGGKIYKTLNGGSTWTADSSGTGAVLWDVEYIPAFQAWIAVGNDGVIRKKSGDSNAVWSNPVTGGSISSGDFFREVKFDGSNGWAVTSSGDIFFSSDVGATWTKQYDGSTSFWALDILSGGARVAVGFSGTIVRYDTSPPTGTVQINSGVVATNSTNATLTLTCSSPGSTCTQMQVAVDGTVDAEPLEAFATTKTVILPSGDGTKTVAVKFKDASGALSAVATDSIIIDTVPPAAATSLARTSAATDQTPTFTWAYPASGDATGFTIDIFNNATLTPPPVINVSGIDREAAAYTVPDANQLAPGSYVFVLRAVDDAGNSTPTSLSFTISSAVANNPPNVPTVLAQRDDLDQADQPVGYTDNDGTVVLKAVVSDPDAGGTLQLQVENKNIATAFTGTFLTSLPVANGSPAQISVGVVNGSYHWRARTIDSAGAASAWVSFGGNAETVADFIVSIPPGADTTPPSAPTNLVRTSPDTSQNPSFSWSASTDNVGVTSYEYQLDGGSFTNIGNVLIATLSTTAVGSHTFGVRARDAAGNTGAISNLNFTISSISGMDTTPPSAPTGITRTTPDSDTTPTFIWNQSTDNVAVTAYHVQIDGGQFIGLGNSTTYTTAILAAGAHTIGVRAGDAAGNTSAVTSLAFTITGAVVEPPPPLPPSSGASPLPAGVNYGDLVKLPNDGDPNTYADTAVFYVGANGKRYVFPNDKTYFTWYSDFNTVKTITPAALATLPLAGNVTYRPGVKMVKLQTNPDVYVVARGGVLRKVPSEEVASSLYGMDWNRKIDDVSDAFWFNYRVDMPLVSATDFSPSAETAGTLTISADKGL